MARASAAAVVDLDAAYPTVTEFRELQLAQLDLSPLNPRKHFDEARLQELAASMGNGVGVIEPLVVRPHALHGNIFEVVAGARRLKAAKIAGLATVPCTIKTLTDAQVLELMVIENDQRADITPLEEAAGFKQLMVFGFDIDKLAARIGRSRKYVYDRVKLLDLIKPAQQLLEGGRITAGHAILLARLTKDQQQRAVAVDDDRYRGAPLFESDASLLAAADVQAEEKAAAKDPYVGMKAKSVRELEAWIATHCRWSPPPDVQRELYPETAAKLEVAKKVVHIHLGQYVQPDARDEDPQRIFGAQSWRRADGLEKSKTCPKSKLGLVVVGEGQGKAFEVCVNRDCPVHFAKEQRAKARAATSPAAADKWKQQQEAQQVKWKREQELRAKREKAWEAAGPAILEAVAEQVRSLPLSTVIDEVLSRENTADIKRARALLAFPASHPGGGEEALRLVMLASFIDAAAGSYSRDRFTTDAKKVLGVDVAALLKKHAPAEVQPSAKAKGKGAAKAGTCRFCGCTEAAACTGGCAWVDQDETVCSNGLCVAAWNREDKAGRRAAKKKKAAKKR